MKKVLIALSSLAISLTFIAQAEAETTRFSQTQDQRQSNEQSLKATCDKTNKESECDTASADFQDKKSTAKAAAESIATAKSSTGEHLGVDVVGLQKTYAGTGGD